MTMQFVTQAELRDLTDLKKPAAIARWLSDHGYVFEISATGWPKVARVLLEARLGLHTPTIKPRPRLNLARGKDEL